MPGVHIGRAAWVRRAIIEEHVRVPDGARIGYDTDEDRRRFLLNLVCFAACIEGLFFFCAFAYVYFLRSKGLLHGLAGGTNWVFRDESAHMAFAFEAVKTIRAEEPDLFDGALERSVHAMLDEAIACETLFAQDLLFDAPSAVS